MGGLGGLGLEVANWMVDRGARNLILVSRSGVTTGYQALCMRKWAEKGVQVETPQINLSSYENAEHFIQQLTKDGKKIGGVFNSGLVRHLTKDQRKNKVSHLHQWQCRKRIQLICICIFYHTLFVYGKFLGFERCRN